MKKRSHHEKSWICHVVDLCSAENHNCCLQILKILLEKDKNEQEKLGGEVFFYISEKLKINHEENKYELYEKILKILFDYYPDREKHVFLQKLIKINNAKAFKTITFCLKELDVMTIDNVFEESILFHAAEHCKDKSIFKEILTKYFQAKEKDFFSFIKVEKNKKSIIERVYRNKDLTIEAVANILFEDPSFDINTICWNGQSLLKMILCSNRMNEYFHLIEKILQMENLDVNDGEQLYLHTACKEKHASLKVIKLFIKHQQNKIDYSQTDNNGKTAIFYTYNQSKIFDHLLKQDLFDLRHQDKNDKNILHHYCKLKNCDEEIIKKILKSSEKEDSLPIINFKDKNGNLPCFYAHPQKKDNWRIAHLIKPKG